MDIVVSEVVGVEVSVDVKDVVIDVVNVDDIVDVIVEL